MEPSSRDERARLPSAFNPLSRAVSAWRCKRCGQLLGRLRGGQLHLKYKDVEHWVSGSCRHSCRRCGTANSILVVGPGSIQ